MSRFGYTRRQVTFDGTSASSSSYTSAPVWVGDAQQISFSWFTNTTGASTLSVDGSDSDGFTSALTTAAQPNVDWSNLTKVTAAGVFTLTAGARFVRFIRAATESQSSVAVAARVY